MTDAPDNLPPLPVTNSRLVGHEEAESRLANAFHSGQLAHAWMITGPEGIGKATLAYRFARYILRHSAEGTATAPVAVTDEPEVGSLFGDPDDSGPGPGPEERNDSEGNGKGALFVADDDPVFKRVAAGAHADLSIIERARKSDKSDDRYTVIRVDDVRGIGSFLHMTPAEGGWRVVIVDAADDMNLNAQNALLKVLEEPPARSLIILVCHAPGRLLPTIRSRCRRLALKPLSSDTVTDLITGMAPDLSSADAARYAEIATGSIGRAMRLIAFDGLSISNQINTLFDNLPNLDVPKLHDLAGGLARRNAEQSYDIATTLIQGRLRARIREDMLASRTARVDRWMEVWENSARLLERADSVNLDRKQVIVGIFHAAAEAAAH